MRIKFRGQRKSGVRYCTRITEEHKRTSRAVWYKRLADAADRVRALSNRPGDIDDWTEMTQARLEFAHIWYRYKLRYDGRVTEEDFQAYIVMTTI